MKKNIKIILNILTLIILCVVIYISLPGLTYALEAITSDTIQETVSQISAALETDVTKFEIREHRGYGIIAGGKSAGEVVSYEGAPSYTGGHTASAGYQGMKNIQAYLDKYMNNAYDWNLGWLYSLYYNTSIYCREYGRTFPDVNRHYLGMFHEYNNYNKSGGYYDANQKHLGDSVIDYVEKLGERACTTTVTVAPQDWDTAGIEMKTELISERELLFSREGASYVQVTAVRLKYSNVRNLTFDTAEGYIYSFNKRIWYRSDPAQQASWIYHAEDNVTSYGGADENGLKLYRAALAVQDLEDPTKPEMSVSNVTQGGVTYSTGTVLDGDSYKIGPIYMNDYQYGWSENVRDVSGKYSLEADENAEIVSHMTEDQKQTFKGLIAGIVEAKVELDNGETIYLNDTNFGYYEQDTAKRDFVDSVSYYESPAKHGYDYPTPNSKFYIKLPISECTGATKIVKVTMKYRWLTADGKGGFLQGYYDNLYWEGTKDFNYETCVYSCKNTQADGCECRNDALSWSNRSAFPGWTYDVHLVAHDFICDKTSHCQYGSSASSTSTSAYVPGSTQSSTRISTSCTYTWTCGYKAHRCNGSYSNFELSGGSVYENCVCGHEHVNTYACYALNCNKYHTHASGCNSNDCSHKNCSSSRCKLKSSGNTSVPCTHSCTSSCCSIDYHTHSSIGGSCYKLICGHSPGSTSCQHLSSCCKYKDYSTTEYASHVHTSSCSRRHDCPKSYCRHGFSGTTHNCGVEGEHASSSCSAKDWGDNHIGRCKGKEGEDSEPHIGTYCPDHGGGKHKSCYQFIWKVIREDKNVRSQNLMFVEEAHVYENQVDTYIEEIPLITKVEIDKYIYEVQHAKSVNGVADDSFIASDTRRDLDEATKEANPVYVETDDFVTYKIIMKNSSAFGVKIKIDDILPEATAYNFISAEFGGSSITDLSTLRNTVIQISAENEAVIKVILQVKALEGTHENRARIITRNGTPKNTTDDIDYIRTIDDDGPIVNHIETTCNGTTDAPEWESSDWFILNNYNTFIDKYVYKYDEAKQRENNNTLLITNETSIVGANNILKETRLNTSTETKKVSDGHLEDTVRVINKVDDGYGNLIGEHELHKANHPVNVEKYEKVTYAIRVSNEAKEVISTHPTGTKPASKFKVSIVEDKLHNGLQYTSISATIFKADGTKKVASVLGVGCSLVGTDGEYNIYNITTSTDTVIEAGEYIEFYMEAKVVQSNMYLFEMRNEARLEKISNINDVDVTERNISEQDSTTEYIRMKDLVISGKVWLDFNKDGLMNDSAENDLDKINNNINDDAMKEDVLVRLYQVDSAENATLIRTTRTDENGLYTFARNEGLSWYTTYNNTVNYSSDTKYQRIDKANNKDANGRYTSSSEYNRYYVEFVYDGVVYKSTEVYAGVDNLTKNDGRYNEKYPIDSNAAELEKDREEFNTEYEYISYDIAYDLNKDKSGDLDFQKDGHSSYLMEDPEREMTSKSFILKYNTASVLNACKTAMNSCGSSKWKSCSNHWDEWQVVIAMGLIDDSAYPNTTAGRKAAQAYLKGIYTTLQNNAAASGNTQMIRYLWLYSFNSGVDRTTPETDYLKYINLGLELREDVDLALTKDVYQVKTTINGEEMEYDYNLGNTLNYTNPYIVNKPYGFEVYEADYKYRIEQYISHAVENFKGNGADELNIEVTYRINLQNLETPDKEGGSVNTPLDAKVHEVLDLYDQNFMKVTDPAITAKIKDNDGKLIDKQIPTGEAWMFMTKGEAAGRPLLEGGKTYAIRESDNGGEPTYVKDNNGNYVKVKLDISGTSEYSEKNNDFLSDGYHTSYISGMGDIIIPEGESIDIYVKYVLDKDQLEITVDEDSYTETEKTEVRVFDETSKTSTTKVVENDNITTVITNIRTETKVLEGKEVTVKVADLRRSIKLAEKINTTFKNTFGRGTENIAQINAYSVWYTDGDPASLVDKDSNAGNIGIKNTSTGKSPRGSGYSETTTSADDVTYYEDMTYKTGIEIVSEGSENTRDIVEKIYDDRIVDEVEIIKEISLTRKISGMVWDDSRSTTLGGEAVTKETAQFIGNGMYNTSDGKIDQAKSNDNVKINYKDASVTEDKDIHVRNAKAEFVEIINVDGKYYEEVLTNVTWDQKQSARTNEDGRYELYGFMPGTYVVRFTYGDYIDIPEDLTTLKDVQKDMLIFNGQDYKSTQYTGANESLDAFKDADKIIVEFNDEHESDARDDELRRLEVNNYSEVMTNEIAEILKGLANGTELTPNSSKNEKDELQALVENTYMIADTREFLVKPEKLLDDTQKPAYEGEYMYSATSPFYKHFTSMKNEHIEEREFNINNVDFGIEYRPESEISLMKEIVQLTLITEDNETLVDLHFVTKNVGSEIVHEIDKEKSIGYDLVQFITNNYKPKSLINNIVSEEYVQGLAYIQVDEEILQGCTVKITYGFNAQNCSEVDRISDNLNEIRYRDNKATDDMIKNYEDKYSASKPLVLVDIKNVIEGRYTASAMAKTAVFADTYGVDDEGLVYREIPKTVTTNGDDGYYGRFVGYGYYTGELSELDEIASLKFDKILDYIDTNLEYEQKTTSEEVIDRLWSKITSRELISLVSHYKGLRATVAAMTDEELPKVTDADGVEYKSMVVSVDDRNVDPGDPNEVGVKAESIKNKDLSRFLIPKVTAVGLNGNDDLGKQNDKDGKLGYDDYTGHIYLDVSKVLAAGSDEDDKTYENMAEIVQFTTLTGRRTNFATTIGNANIHDIKNRLENDLPPFDETEGNNSGSIEFITASIEPDTSATETITLIPPTGLMKNRRAIVSIMETAKAGVEVMSMTGLVVAIVAAIAFLVILVIRKYQKRRIK